MSDVNPLCLSVVLLAAAVFHAPASTGQEAVVTLRSTVTGNQEQPRVMYIVPWQPPGRSKFEYSLGSDIAKELFAPVDREEFVRGIKYQAMIESSSSSESAED